MKPLIRKEYTTQLVEYRNKKDKVKFREISYNFTVFSIPLFHKVEHTQLPDDYNIDKPIGFHKK